MSMSGPDLGVDPSLSTWPNTSSVPFSRPRNAAMKQTPCRCCTTPSPSFLIDKAPSAETPAPWPFFCCSAGNRKNCICFSATLICATLVSFVIIEHAAADRRTVRKFRWHIVMLEAEFHKKQIRELTSLRLHGIQLRHPGRAGDREQFPGCRRAGKVAESL